MGPSSCCRQAPEMISGVGTTPTGQSGSSLRLPPAAGRASRPWQRPWVRGKAQPRGKREGGEGGRPEEPAARTVHTAAATDQPARRSFGLESRRLGAVPPESAGCRGYTPPGVTVRARGGPPARVPWERSRADPCHPAELEPLSAGRTDTRTWGRENGASASCRRAGGKEAPLRPRGSCARGRGNRGLAGSQKPLSARG